ncbi:MAG: hypothetical protein GSR73_05220 [Desulfurococcales archaeon]|nr:hypothetical protein [Desulfurococcales archaeon]
MPRATLGWYRCEVCGRKAYVYQCRYNGRTVLICPYCILALWGYRGFYCNAPIVKKLGKVAPTARWGEADTLVSSIDSRLKSKAGYKGRKPSRGRARRR